MTAHPAPRKGRKAAEPASAFGRRLAKLRAVTVDAVTEDDLRAIVVKLVEQAKAGNLSAIREVLTRLVGKPADAPDPDRLDVEAITIDAEKLEAEHRRHNETRTDSDLDNMLGEC